MLSTLLAILLLIAGLGHAPGIGQPDLLPAEKPSVIHEHLGSASWVLFEFWKHLTRCAGKRLMKLSGLRWHLTQLHVRCRVPDQATAGDTHLGGEDFDNRLTAHCIAVRGA
jgi:hypothetical protein